MRRVSQTRLLAVCADGAAVAGSGHLARCLALVQAWRDDRGEAVLLTEGGAGWPARYEAEGVTILPVDALPSLDPGWLVVDGYGYGDRECLAGRAQGALVLVIDDHGFGHAGPADSLLDQNLGASPAVYRHRVGLDGLLLGPSYVLLRREFAAARTRAEMRRPPDRPRRVLLALGGAPPEPVVRLFEAIAAGLSPDHEVRWLRGAADVTVEMLQADLAVSASGSTSWELCCLGVPTALVSTTENQRPVADALGRAGITLDMGPHEQVDPVRVLEATRILSKDAARRGAMTQASMALVDAAGARRVVAHLRGRRLALRPVVASDARLLWRWVNDPSTRASAFDTRPIPWEVHEPWLAGKLVDPGCTMYMAEDGEAAAVGQIRFDQQGDRAVVDVAVAPEERGEGWGPALIDAGVRRFWRDRKAVAIDALVKPDNLASARSFDLAGFELTGLGGSDHDPWLRYVRRCDDAL